MSAGGRRRWLTLAEIVALAGVVIAALTLYNNWQDRRADERAQQSEAAGAAEAAHAQAIVTLKGTPQNGGATLALADPDHPVQSIDAAFPKALGVAPQKSVLQPHIDAGWFATPLLALAHGGDQDGELPVLLTTRYWTGEVQHRDTAIYGLIYHIEGRFLRGRAVRLKGLVLEQRQGATQAALDALWAKDRPKG